MSIAERLSRTWLSDLSLRGQGLSVNEVVEESWGWFPALTVVNALGLLLIAFANTRALALTWGAEALFWVGLLGILLPSAVRLIAMEVARRERIGIVLALGLAFYLVKVIHSPLAFTNGDEFLHLFNTNQVWSQGVLFSENMVLQVSPLFPGLAAVTAALATLTGLSTFAAGLILLGVVRVVFVLAFYLLAEQLSRSVRVASLAVLFYMCHGNFLFWSAQFAYESLALPLAMGVLYLIARRESSVEPNHFSGLSLLAMLGISAVVITHHLTSYILAAFLLTWWLLVEARLPSLLTMGVKDFFSRSNSKLSNEKLTNTMILPSASATGAKATLTQSLREKGPQGLAIFALVAAMAWLIYVALVTVNYLAPVVGKGFFALLQLIFGEGQGRTLFTSVNGSVAPLWERVVGIGAVLLSLAGLPFGLRQIWRHTRDSVPALLLAVAAISYFAVFGLRLTVASWEIGNRASTYLFIGLAFVLAMGVDWLWNEQRQGRVARSLFAVAVALLFTGGVVAAWPPQLRLAQPYLVATDTATVEAPGLATAEWFRTTVGPKHIVATDESNGRYLLAYGEQRLYVGRHPFVTEILTQPTLDPWQVAVMRQWNLQYVVVDRRRVAWDNMAGYFFTPTAASQDAGAAWLAPEVVEKFARQAKVSRVMDSGDIVIYDVGALYHD
ncbi:MAG: hypothetical protein R3C14_09065 [Caldilineaceae bacterium]